MHDDCNKGTSCTHNVRCCVQGVLCCLQHPKITSHVCDGHQQKLKLLLYYGAYIYMGLTGLNGTPQGEQIQWHDLYISLLLMGYHPTLVHTQRQLTVDYLDAYDLVITDYYGVNAAIDARSLSKHRCKLRLLDSWGTDAGPNERNGHGFCCLKVPSLSQFWTFTPKHSPDNSFLGYRVDSFRQVQVFESNATPVRKLEVLLYGKEYKFFTEDLTYINQLSKYAPTHATAMDVPSNALPDVMNHGVLAPNGLHKLMQETFAYAGFGAVMMGPAAIEALSNGMIFLNYAFCPPRNLSVTQGKPTTQLWTSQFPFLEHEGPHAITINTHNASDVKGKLQQLRQTYQEWWVQGQYRPLRTEAIMGEYVFLGLTHGHRSGYVPYEYTTVAMLLRVNNLVRADVCE